MKVWVGGLMVWMGGERLDGSAWYGRVAGWWVNDCMDEKDVFPSPSITLSLPK